jgi:hypothetical protein
MAASLNANYTRQHASRHDDDLSKRPFQHFTIHCKKNIHERLKYIQAFSSAEFAHFVPISKRSQLYAEISLFYFVKLVQYPHSHVLYVCMCYNSNRHGFERNFHQRHANVDVCTETRIIR